MLKAYEFETTMETGHRLPMYLIFRTLVIDNDKHAATLLFQGYPTQIERERQTEKGEGKFFEFPLILSGVDYLALFSVPINNALGLAISDIVWQLAGNVKFIADFTLNEKGELVPEKKSLIDLNAALVELPVSLPEEMGALIAERSAALFGTENEQLPAANNQR